MKMKIWIAVLGAIAWSFASAEAVRLTPVDSDPSLRGALTRAADKAGWKVTWEIPPVLGFQIKTYDAEWPVVLKQAADDQLKAQQAMHEHFHALACPDTKTLRVVSVSLQSCEQASPPIMKMTITAKGKKPMEVHYFQGSIDQEVVSGNKPWTALGHGVTAKIERVQ